MVRKMEMSVKIICPYVNDKEINQQKNNYGIFLYILKKTMHELVQI